jgi:hypothetical protein
MFHYSFFFEPASESFATNLKLIVNNVRKGLFKQFLGNKNEFPVALVRIVLDKSPPPPPKIVVKFFLA